MKKLSIILFALFLLISFAACANTTPAETESSESSSYEEQRSSETDQASGTDEALTEDSSEEAESEEISEAEDVVLYEVGETVSTDSMACTLLSVEEEDGYIKVTYSLENIGKKSLSSAWIYTPGAITSKCEGLSLLDYNDGYIFDEHAINAVDNELLSDLKPLGDIVTITDVFVDVPEEVWSNKDAPLLVRINLYSEQINEKAEYEDSWHESAVDAAKHTVTFTYKVR